MPQRRRTTLLWSLAFLGALSGCVAPQGGLFCDVVPGPIQFSAPVAAAIVHSADRRDRQAGVEIDAQNRVGAKDCGW